MEYKVLTNNYFELDSYSLVPYRQEDIFKIMNWRNEQMGILRQKNVLTQADQEAYYKNYIEPSFSDISTKIILFSFIKGKECIGYGGLTNIDWESKRAEVSFLLDPERVQDNDIYKKEFAIYLQLLKKVAFEDLKFHRLFTETYDIRPIHISILESQGFKFEGRMKDHILINDKYYDSLIHGLLNQGEKDE